MTTENKLNGTFLFSIKLNSIFGISNYKVRQNLLLDGQF